MRVLSLAALTALSCAGPSEAPVPPPSAAISDAALESLHRAAQSRDLAPAALALEGPAELSIASLEGLAERGDLADPVRDRTVVVEVRALLAASPVPDVRAAAARALGSWLADLENREAVRASAASDHDPLVREAARQTLVEAGE